MTLDLGSSLRQVRGIGPSRQRQLEEQGVLTVLDLLTHVPFRYEDRRSVASVDTIDDEGDFTLMGRLQDVRVAMRRGRRFSMVRGRFSDGSGELGVVWFNRPYLPKQIDESLEYLLHGRVRRRPSGLELQNPSCEPASAAMRAGRIVPVYPALGPLGPALVRRILGHLIEDADLEAAVAEPLPAELLARHGLEPLGRALELLHRPSDTADAAELNGRGSAAHRRLIYGELFTFQLRLALAQLDARQATKGHRVEWSGEVGRMAGEVLPFALTGAQERVIREVLADLAAARPMRRLVQGDVGSGKTAVAAVALVAVLEAGLQGAFMAPTEILAEQHHATLAAMFGQRHRVELLTGTTSSDSLRRDIEDGAVQLVVGTQALIQQQVAFRSLGLAVVDEQHRFGVAQRAALGDKGDRADLLVMTATPIPRTLTLTAYGDLDLSIIDQLPPGRTPIETRVLPTEERPAVYDRLRDELARGGQAYIVFPRIRRSAKASGPSLEEGVEWVRRRFADIRVGVLHGEVALEERCRIMREFADGEVRLLLATTVIEVGVDVPEATVMVIEGAERFGLAQLHQLRGRVGRGPRSSICMAVHGESTEDAARRLEVFARTADGFEIAEEDLLIRGPGELLGKRQAGMPTFRVADLRTDGELLADARQDARRLVADSRAAQARELVHLLDGEGKEDPSARLTRA